MKLRAFQSRYELRKGESPMVLIDAARAEAWFGRDPFEVVEDEGLSYNLVMAAEGTVDGHNLILDSTFTDGVRGDHWTPISPLFVKDLAGRAIYIGFGPERKGNAEWMAYAVKAGPDGQIADEDVHPFAPLCVFPRFCRDAAAMEGSELLEQVFLTKFRCLEMSFGFNGQLSGTDEAEDLVAATYLGANLYPYKVRLDTFYVDGFKLPQTQLLFAKGELEGVDPARGKQIGDAFLAAWQGRATGLGYEDWLAGLNPDELEGMYQSGCTVIPTVDACNGYHVVARDFGLEDYWPGRAVLGLHEVVERVGNQAPAGTILEVVQPGYVTATTIRQAKVIVSDGSGYVSPNATDPMPLVPNLFLPHCRTLDDWRATWVPTHPEHFEAPALWGWDLTQGRFMQMHGPIWDPLHYYYESVDRVLQAFDKSPVSADKPLVAVPHDMEHRFFPVVPMMGFDTFSDKAFSDKIDRGVKPVCSIRRVPTQELTVGIGYHPLPAEYEFELDPFWFPEMHPQNRDLPPVPDDLQEAVVPVITPTLAVADYVATVDGPAEAVWLTQAAWLMEPALDALENYPFLLRYLVSDVDVETVAKLCPTPFLSDPGDKLAYPASGWWLDGDGNQLDGPLAMQEVADNVHDALWDMRQEGVELVQFRHMVYRTNLPLYILAWWNSWSIEQFGKAMEGWIQPDAAEEVPLEELALPPQIEEQRYEEGANS